MFIKKQEGFSLTETIFGITILGVCTLYVIPLVFYTRASSVKSEIRMGALVVSQRIFDNIRSKPFKDIPFTDGLTSTATFNPVLIPRQITTPNKDELLQTKVGSRQYQAKVTYCPGLDYLKSEICDIHVRKFTVEVSYNGSQVYVLQGNYTDFK